MNGIFKAGALLMVVFVFSGSSNGQSPTSIERELVTHLKNIDNWSMKTDRTGEDLSEAIGREDAVFRTKLLKYTKRRSTLNYGFRKLAKQMHIATSPDGKFRVYSRDTRMGGTMRFFETIYQFEGEDGRVHSQLDNLEEGDPGGFVSDVFELVTKTGKVYLVRVSSILSTSDSHQSLEIFRIEGDSLDDDAKLIKTDSGLTNSIGFSYDFFSVVDRKERPLKLINFDPSTKTITIPVVTFDSEFSGGRVTGEFINYQFTGTYFEKVK